jgi:hypothetical protein
MQRDIRLVTVVTAETTTQGRSLLAWHLFISAMMFCHRAAVATEVPPNLRTVQVFMLRGEQRSKQEDTQVFESVDGCSLFGAAIVGVEWVMIV